MSSPRSDRIGWLSLAWAVAFGLMYSFSMVQARLPGILVAVRRSLGG